MTVSRWLGERFADRLLQATPAPSRRVVGPTRAAESITEITEFTEFTETTDEPN